MRGYKGKYTEKNQYEYGNEYGQNEDNFNKKTKRSTGTRKSSTMKKKRSF